MNKEIEKVFQEFWVPIIFNLRNGTRTGKLNLEQLKKELFDYYNLLNEVPKVYDHVTGGLISKPNTKAFEVIAAADNRMNEFVEDAVREHESN